MTGAGEAAEFATGVGWFDGQGGRPMLLGWGRLRQAHMTAATPRAKAPAAARTGGTRSGIVRRIE